MLRLSYFSFKHNEIDSTNNLINRLMIDCYIVHLNSKVKSRIYIYLYNPSFIFTMLILASRKVNETLQEFILKDSEPVSRFLYGFRNKISEGLQWVLVHDDYFSGQAFCFQPVESEEQRTKLEAYEDAETKVQVILGNYVVVAKSDLKFARPEVLAQLPAEQLAQLRIDIAHPSKEIEDNIFLNNFESFEAYKASQFSLITSTPNSNLIDNQEKGKGFCGDRTFIVPRLNPTTGDWSYQNEITLKLQNSGAKKQTIEAETA